MLANPAAGRGHAPRLAARLAEQLRGDGHAVVELVADTPAAALHRCRAAVADRADAVVAVGGDGLVHLAVQAVAGTATALGVLAAGTGDDVARGLGLPTRDAAAGLASVRAGVAAPPRRVDVVRCRGATGSTWYVGVLAAGFDALVNRRANAMRRPRGPARYPLAVALELPWLRPRRYALRLDGAEQRTEAVLVAVANGPCYGGGLRIAAPAVMDDGLLDVVVVGPVGRAELLRVLPSLRRGGHLGHPQVRVQRARQVRVALADPGPPQPGYADGEPVGPLPLECAVVPAGLRVLDPAQL